MSYCPDCGWDGYLEGVSKPCGGLSAQTYGLDDDGVDDTILDDGTD